MRPRNRFNSRSLIKHSTSHSNWWQWWRTRSSALNYNVNHQQRTNESTSSNIYYAQEITTGRIDSCSTLAISSYLPDNLPLAECVLCIFHWMPGSIFHERLHFAPLLCSRGPSFLRNTEVLRSRRYAVCYFHWRLIYLKPAATRRQKIK